MRGKALGLALLSLGLLVGHGSTDPQNRVTAGEPWWITDYDDAIEKAKESGKPILVSFR